MYIQMIEYGDTVQSKCKLMQCIIYYTTKRKGPHMEKKRPLHRKKYPVKRKKGFPHGEEYPDKEK